MFYSFAKFEKLFRKNPHLLTILRAYLDYLMKRSIKLWNSANTDLKKHCILTIPLRFGTPYHVTVMKCS